MSIQPLILSQSKLIILEDEDIWQHNISKPLLKVHPDLEVIRKKTLDAFRQELDLNLSSPLYLIIDLRVPLNEDHNDSESVVDDVITWFSDEYPAFLDNYIKIHHDSPRVVIISGELNMERRHQLIRAGIHGDYIIYKTSWSDRTDDVLEYFHKQRGIPAKIENLCDIELFVGKHLFPIEDSIIRAKANVPLRATVVIRSTANLLPRNKLIGKTVVVGIYCDGAYVEDEEGRYDLALRAQQKDGRVERTLDIKPAYYCTATTFEIQWHELPRKPRDLSTERELTVYISLNGRLIHLFKLPIQLIGSEQI